MDPNFRAANLKYIRGAKSTEYTVVELKALAKSKNITGYSKMNKEPLCKALGINYVQTAMSIIKNANKVSKDNHRKGILNKCDSARPVYPCSLKRAVFKSEEEWMEYVKLKRATHVKNSRNRKDAVKLANIELEKEKESLKEKKTPVKKVRFQSPVKNEKNIKKLHVK
jgi:hypothetical protein